MVPIRLKNGATVFVETLPAASPAQPPVDSPAADEDLVPDGAAMSFAPLPAKEFEEAVTVVEGIADELAERLGRADKNRARKGMRLSELTLGVKVGFDAKGNVFIASGSASASLELQLKWELDSPKEE